MNAIIGWLCITIGFLSGAWLGLGFDQPGWMGGYDSPRRRLVRLGHIAFVALGMINILFSIAAPGGGDFPAASVARMGFAVGALSMPLCCFLTAWRPGLKPIFAVPVICLVTAGALTVQGAIAS